MDVLIFVVHTICSKAASEFVASFVYRECVEAVSQ